MRAYLEEVDRELEQVQDLHNCKDPQGIDGRYLRVNAGELGGLVGREKMRSELKKGLEALLDLPLLTLLLALLHERIFLLV